MNSMTVCMSLVEPMLTVRIVKNLSVVKRVYLYICVFACVLLIAEARIFIDNIFDGIMFRFERTIIELVPSALYYFFDYIQSNC